MKKQSSSSSKTRFALLGILAIQPHSGYEIKKFIESSLAYFWKESYGQIYPVLKQLTNEGAITSRTIHQIGKPDKTVYSITEKGHNALRKWLEEPAEKEMLRSEFLLKLFLGSNSQPDDILHHITGYQEKIENELEQYQEISQMINTQFADNENAFYWKLVLDLGIRRLNVSLQWCKDAVINIKNHNHKF